MSLETILVPCFTDNYAVLVHDTASNKTLCVDAPEARPILSALSERDWQLDTLLITHHHHDHIGGNDQLKSITGTKIIGPEAEKRQIPNMDETVSDGDEIEFAGHPIHVFATPGHTLGHVSYHWPDDHLLFSGDTLFALGCGRLFEGTPAQMWASLSKLKALPGKTQVFCGHEYTLSNAEFAISQEPDNIDLQMRLMEIRDKRSKNQPTLPSTIELEKRTNPFLRPDSAEIRKKLNLQSADDEAVFKELRRLKDQA